MGAKAAGGGRGVLDAVSGFQAEEEVRSQVP